jgi:hypothetical protein
MHMHVYKDPRPGSPVKRPADCRTDIGRQGPTVLGKELRDKEIKRQVLSLAENVASGVLGAPAVIE